MSDSDSSDDEVGFSNLFKTTYTNQSITLDSLSPSSFTTETPSFSAPSSSASPSSSAAAASSSSSSSPTDVETITEYVKVYQLKLSQAATTDYDKTGEILWPAAYSLARFMAVNSHRFFNGKTVLELGAGMGLPSIVLLGNAKPSVLIGSDHQSSILTILRENMDRASKQAPRYLERTVELCATVEAETEESTGGRKRTIVSEREVQFEQATSSLPAVAWDTAKFEWGKPEHIAAIRSQALRLLNRQDEHFEGFDFIIASDVVYSSDAVAGLLTSVRALLRPDSGRFIMAHRTRWAIVDRALAAAWADYRISRAVDADAFTAVSIPDDEQIFIQSLDS